MLKVMKIYHIITSHSIEEDMLLKTMKLVLEMHFVFENNESIFHALLEQTKVKSISTLSNVTLNTLT